MKPSHALLMLLGLVTQVVGWNLLPQRAKVFSSPYVILLDGAWILWYVRDDRSLSVVGVWALSPVATWATFHLFLAPIVGVEVLARLLPWRAWVRILGLGFLFLGYAWGLGEAYGPPVLTAVSLSFPDLPPAFDGYRIVLFGDVHAGPYAGTRTVTRWAHAISRVPSDLVVAAGDFVAFAPEEAEHTGVAFQILHPRDGLVGALGNHDQYSRNDDVAQRLRHHGWAMLLDQMLSIERGDQRLLLLGARYATGHQETSQPNWQGKPWPQGFRIGLCHSPEQWPLLLKEDVNLTLSAHFHGGQVNLSPFFNAALERSPYVKGLYQKGPNCLFVTQGLGCTILPFRFRSRPEIVQITLHRSNRVR